MEIAKSFETTCNMRKGYTSRLYTEGESNLLLRGDGEGNYCGFFVGKGGEWTVKERKLNLYILSVGSRRS